MRRVGSRSTRLALAALTGLAACGGDGPGGASVDQVTEPAPEGVHGAAPAALNGIPSVVLLTPAAPANASTAIAGAPVAADEAVIDQFGLAFSPTRLLASPGVVRFTNSEAALSHNVHVRRIGSGETVFNDDAGSGETIELVLDQAGGYDVICDMHPGMTAFIFLTDAPYAVIAEEDGSFDLGAVAEGDYLAQVWTATDGYLDSVAVTVAEGSTEVDLRPTD